MHIYIDESGVFKAAPGPESWCAVAALVVPETDLRKLRTLLTPLKISAGKTYTDEVKLGQLKEQDYFRFLEALGKLDVTVYSVATDMSLLTENEIVHHRNEQAARVLTHIDTMKYEEGRQGLRQLSNETAALSPQLYMQLICQVSLVQQVIDRGTFYHVQRTPKSLRRFRWRIDQKNTTKSLFEITFEKLTPGLLQTMSLERPSIACVDFDHSAMSDFMYGDDAPTYLKNSYGIDVEARGGFNTGKLLRTDLAFPDSRSEEGLQIVDLIVSGIGRLLRGRFEDPDTAARLLGSLMVQNFKGAFPLQFISFVSGKAVSPRVAELTKKISASARPLIYPPLRRRLR